MKKSNKIVTHLFNEGKIDSPMGLPHFGGKQCMHIDEDGSFIANMDPEELGRIVASMTDEEIENIINSKL